MNATASENSKIPWPNRMPAASSSSLTNRAGARTWVLVAGDFHRGGGMDRANAEFAEYLCTTGATVHLVSFRVDPELAAHPNVHVHRATRVAGAHFLGQRRLDRLGRSVAAKMIADAPDTRVLVNGVNCTWSDINWVHFVHREWLISPPAAPLWFRLKHGFDGWSNARKEIRLLRNARIVIANSERTRTDLIRDVGVDSDRVHTVYLGCGSEWQPITPDRRAAARAWLGIRSDRPLAAFVGAFGHDSRKGFDTLWPAWRSLCEGSNWDADLIVAGGGRALPRWRTEIDRAGLASRVRMLGFTDRINDVLAAADLLVSPVRYESYGLNVQEALASGIPAIVSSSAGVAERYPEELTDLLLPNPDDVNDLVMRLRRWRADMEELKRRVAPLAAMLRGWSWRDMAAQIVAISESSPAAQTSSGSLAAQTPPESAAERLGIGSEPV
jgi:glycosyltransferase involved in cell wall biosynthesis